jgi:hypothetical protein
VYDLPEQARPGADRLQPQPRDIPLGIRSGDHDPTLGLGSGDHLAPVLDRLPGRPGIVQGHRGVALQDGGGRLPQSPGTGGAAVVDLDALPEGAQDQSVALGDLESLRDVVALGGQGRDCGDGDAGGGQGESEQDEPSPQGDSSALARLGAAWTERANPTQSPGRVKLLISSMRLNPTTASCWIRTAGWGDSNSTAPQLVIRGQEATGGLSRGFFDPLVTVSVHGCP